MPLSRPLAAAVLLSLAALPPAHGQGPTETISIRVSEGTLLALDVAPDGRIVLDLLGQLWEVGPGGGAARPLTDAVRDTAEDADPSYAPDGRRVVFRGERRGRTGLWLLEPGRPPRQLTQLGDPGGQDGSAAWSPDGRTIAFAQMLPPDSARPRWGSAIALIDAAGRDSARLLRIDGLPAPDARDPAWEPGGRRIALVARNARAPKGGRIWIVDAAGGKAAPLSPDGVEALAPAFAPDARRIAFLAPDSADRTQVWVQDLRTPGAVPVRLTSHADVAATRVRWTGNGRALAYSADGRLWTVSADGGTPTEIRFTVELTFERPRRNLPDAHFPVPGRSEPVHAFTGLALSPDARSIAMLALGKLWVMPVSGGTPRAVAGVPPTARYATWSADGSAVAWSAGRAGEEDIFATEVAGGATHRVTALPGREVFPAYSPDGRHLAFVHGAPGGTAWLRVTDAGTRDLSGTSRAGILDSLDLNWTASGADVPIWTPASDGLLRTAGGWGSGPTSAVLVRLSGERRTITRVPDSPIYLQWQDGAILYLRHARLWRAPFDSTGTTARAQPLGADPAMYLSAAADGTLLYVSDGGLRLRAPDGSERRLGWPLSFTPPVPRPLVIRNARVIDGTGTPATPPRDILIEGGRIRRIEPAGALDAMARDSAARDVLDAAGGFVMPGLMDLHAHLYTTALLPGFLYFGVTTVRDQGSPIGPLVAYAEGSAAGVFEGPRVGYGGFQLYSDWAYDTEDGLGVEPETDPTHAARSVALAALFGAQHVKTRTFRRWDINARMVSEAHRRGLRATGHCAHQLPLVAAGMDAQEHAGFCGRRGDGPIYDDLIQLYRTAGIAVVPTIAYSAFTVWLTSPELLDQDTEVAPFLPPKESFGWMLRMDAEDRRETARSAGIAREAARKLARAGVTIGVGTDVWQVPTAVHMELEELVAAGLSPLEAIRAGTGDAARILGAASDLGTVAVGKLADLVVLDADPVADIRNTRRIRAVVQGGRVVDRKTLSGR